MNKIKNIGRTDPIVTPVSMTIVLGFVAYCGILSDEANVIFQEISSVILNNFKWLYLLSTTGLVVLLIYLALSRYGDIKLGRADETPEFSYKTWISMIFSGSMGIGLIFWSVSEPMLHYAGNPFSDTSLSNESAELAMQITFFHWGLHPWAIFIIVALAVAYFAYRKGLPLTMRSVLYPILGERIHGPIGHVVDIAAVAITAFGIAQSLGLGVIQMNTGLNRVFDIGINFQTQATIIIVISILALLSVISGVNRGIKILSEWNMLLSIVILLSILIIGPTRDIVNTLIETTGEYLSNLVYFSTWSDAQQDSGWQNWWTAFYWPWWMTWAPFVGIFIARISKGRTIRELISGALIVPTLITFVWISVFGGTAIKMEHQDRLAYQEQVQSNTQAQSTPEQLSSTSSNPPVAFTGGDILQETQKESTTAIFSMFDKVVPGNIATMLSVLTVILLATYFITSADSGTLVLCTLNSYGSYDPPMSLRLTWGIMQALIAAGLLYAGGLKAIQTAAIIAGLPIAIMLILMSIALMKSLREEHTPIAQQAHSTPEETAVSPEQAESV